MKDLARIKVRPARVPDQEALPARLEVVFQRIESLALQKTLTFAIELLHSFGGGGKPIMVYRAAGAGLPAAQGEAVGPGLLRPGAQEAPAALPPAPVAVPFAPPAAVEPAGPVVLGPPAPVVLDPPPAPPAPVDALATTPRHPGRCLSRRRCVGAPRGHRPDRKDLLLIDSPASLRQARIGWHERAPVFGRWQRELASARSLRSASGSDQYPSEREGTSQHGVQLSPREHGRRC